MTMIRIATTLALAFFLGLTGCKSDASSTNDDLALAGATAQPCTCGQPSADIYGCAFPACVNGTGNPANDLCACGALYASGAQAIAVSFGGAATSRELGRRQALSLSDTSIVRGILRADDGLSVTLELSNGNSQVIAYDDLAPRSIYRLMKGRVSKDDGAGLIELGNYTRDNGLYAYSKRHYKDALKADKSLKPELEVEVAKLREVASDDMLRRAQDALAKGDMREAEKQLSRILTELPDEAAAQTAHAIMGDLATQAETTRVRHEQEQDASNATAIVKELAPAQRRYDRAIEENRKGMLASSGSSRARKHYEKSTSEGGRGRKAVTSAERKNSKRTGFPEAAATLDRKLVDVIVTASLNLAGISLSKSSYNKAMDHTNEALVVDPSSTEARAMKSRIENASANSGIGNGWGSGLGGWYLSSGGRVGHTRRMGGGRIR